ncbi:MAG: CDP-alcohol phosphatidyltransferase family protein [Candidatus Aminicenantes bacterium]|nr:CDP-alcohol phosphatidyltransferase family protein [Candidatus Aminicenantes bacterium]
MDNGQEKLYEIKSTFFTLPNSLTLLRIILVPFFVSALLKQKQSAAFFIFLAASLTDLLDGLIARIWHQKSMAGLWLDPVADKLLLFSSFFTLSLSEYAHPNVIPWRVFWVVLGKDLLILIGALALIILKKKSHFPPTYSGKTATVCQVLTIMAVLLLNFLGKELSLLSWLYDLTILSTVVAGLQYIWVGITVLKNSPEQN